jgi:hypothetical protein
VTLSDRALRRLTWISAVVIGIGFVVTFTLDVLSRPDEALFSALLLTFPLVGFVVITRRPRATLGWLMVAMGYGYALPFTSYGAYALGPRQGELPFGELALGLGGPDWVPFIGISGYLLLLFPDGHLPSPRWRWFAWACGIALVLVVIFIWLYPGTMDEAGFPDVRNPLGIEVLEPLIDSFLVLLFAAPILVLGGAVGLIVRLRRTRDDVVRHQIRWLTYVAALIAGFFVLAFVPTLNDESEWTSWVQDLSAMSFMLIPIAIGIAVLRYRLYDIDVVIKKTVVAAVLAAFVVVAYVGIVVGVGALVGGRDAEGSSFLTIAAAGIVALMFQPLRTRARRLADRIVYGKRATPYQVLGTFGDQLAGTHSSDDVLPRLARVLAEGVGAERARVWLRVGGELRVVATWPTDQDVGGSDDDFTTEVRYHGEELGALSVAMPANDPMNPTKEELVRHLAGQGGLVLSNVRLTEELRARAAAARRARREAQARRHLGGSRFRKGA